MLERCKRNNILILCVLTIVQIVIVDCGQVLSSGWSDRVNEAVSCISTFDESGIQLHTYYTGEGEPYEITPTPDGTNANLTPRQPTSYEHSFDTNTYAAYSLYYCYGGTWKLAGSNAVPFYFINESDHCSNLEYQGNIAGQPCQAENPCEAEIAAAVVECGGAEYVDESTLNEETCEIKCVCDGDTTYMDLVHFCGSKEKTNYDPLTCSGSCGDCMAEYMAFEDECKAAGLLVKSFDWNTCMDGVCTDDCSDEYQAKEALCAPFPVVNWSDETCSGECAKDCTAEYNALEDKCGIVGIKSWNEATCEGVCNNCEERVADCSASCSGVVKSYNCDDGEAGGKYVALNETRCVCGDPEQLLGGDMPVILGPGSSGGSLTNNPDGSTTENLEDGTRIEYSADGKTAHIYYPSGGQYKQVVNPDGSITHYLVDENGNFREQTVMYQDGVAIVLNEQSGYLPDSNLLGYVDPEQEFTYTVEDNDDGTQTVVVTTRTYDGDGNVLTEDTQTLIRNEGEGLALESQDGGMLTLIYGNPGVVATSIRAGVDFAAWDASWLKMKEKLPSNIISNSMQPLLDIMTEAEEQPSFDIPLINSQYIGSHSLHVDLQPFQPFLVVWRFLLGCWFIMLTFNRISALWAGVR